MRVGDRVGGWVRLRSMKRLGVDAVTESQGCRRFGNCAALRASLSVLSRGFADSDLIPRSINVPLPLFYSSTYGSTRIESAKSYMLS